MAVVVAGLAFTPPVHSALLEGQTIAVYHLHQVTPDMTTVIGPVEQVVGPGVEFAAFGWDGFVDIDVSDTTIVITLNTNQPPALSDTLVFTDPTGTILEFTGATVNPATTYAGFDASRVSVSAGTITLSLTGLLGLPGQQIVLDVTGADPIPQPLAVGVDIRPRHCFAVLQNAGFLPVAIRGSDSLDVSQIDPVSVRLNGVAPIQSVLADAAGQQCWEGPDGSADFVLLFRGPEVFATLGPVVNGSIRTLTITGQVKPEFGGTEIQGEDYVFVLVAPTGGPEF
jgi:hypothetical protein